jgi:xanthine dehydrogenase YagR molybdenum-binding subunit
MTRHNNLPEPFFQATKCLYAADHIRLSIDVADRHMLANTFMRAPGESVGTFALESALDELAEPLDMDPLELRRCNEPEQDPTSGLAFSSRHLLEAARAGAERFGWQDRATQPARRRMATRNGLRDGDLPLHTHARRGGPNHAHGGRGDDGYRRA